MESKNYKELDDKVKNWLTGLKYGHKFTTKDARMMENLLRLTGHPCAVVISGIVYPDGTKTTPICRMITANHTMKEMATILLGTKV